MRLIILILLVLGGGIAYRNFVVKTYKESPAEASLVATHIEAGTITEKLFTPRSKYVVAYYSASWCGPCQQFTPSLVNFYQNQLKDDTKAPDFDLILVSRDRSQNDMVNYMRSHRITFGGLSPDERQGWLARPPSGTGIPNLVIIDQQTGKVIDECYVNGVYQGPQRVLAKLATLLKE